MVSESADMIGRLAGSDGDVVSPSGARIGRIGQVYADDRTGEPSWVTIRDSSGGSAAFVPLRGARLAGDDVVVAYEAEVVSGAPRVGDDGSITPAEESELLRYYEGAARGVTPESPSPASSGTDDAMTRSEERLRVGVQRRVTERVRVRKVIVTEEVTQTITLRREELLIEREPVSGGPAEALDAADVPDEAYDVVLYAERPVVTTQVVPVERVRIAKERVTEHVTVSEDLRSEQIDTTFEETPRPVSG